MGSMAESKIKTLLDEGSFVEIKKAVTARATDFNLNEAETPGDGVVTGYGTIEGNLVYVYSQDESVLNGTIGEMHAKKISNIYDMAMKMGAPVVALIASAGMRLQEGSDALEAFGSIYNSQALASGVIPQITAVFGTCGGGLSIVAGMSDFVFVEEKKGRMFLNSPNAIVGNTIEKEDTSKALFQSESTGVVDAVTSEAQILADIRRLVAMLPLNNSGDMSPFVSADDLNRRLINPLGGMEDSAILLAQIADDNFFFETKKDYARDMVTGFLRLGGMTIGALANRLKKYDENAEVKETYSGALGATAARKAASFVNFCDAFEIPILTLTNVDGFQTTMCAEKNLAREAAKLTGAFASATVPKVNVICGKAFGSAYTVMNSKSLGADMVFAWPNAKIGLMNAQMAAKVMYPEENDKQLKEKAAAYDALQNSPDSAARRGYIDAIIEPEETRKYLIGAFEMLYTKRVDVPFKKHGTK